MIFKFAFRPRRASRLQGEVVWFLVAPLGAKHHRISPHLAGMWAGIALLLPRDLQWRLWSGRGMLPPGFY
jgi:hypothetical protein